jgi:hypothetical protein
LRKDEFATPNAPNKSVAGTRNIVQADIKVSFMGPQDSYESQAIYPVCSNLSPSGRDADATDGRLAPPTIAITSGDSQYIHSAPFLRRGLNGIKKSLGR